MKPHFTIEDIKDSVDTATFERAVGLYENGKVHNLIKIKTDLVVKASVQGSKWYQVSVSLQNPQKASCSCYIGVNEEHLCKHMVALALHIVLKGRVLSDQERLKIDVPLCSGKPGELSKSELQGVKTQITEALRFIRPYQGPSRIWFEYQGRLDTAALKIARIVYELPVSKQTAYILVDIALRLDRKLHNAVDDSDGTIGNCISDIVEVLKEYARIDPECIQAFAKLRNQNTIFDWQYELLEYLESGE